MLFLYVLFYVSRFTTVITVKITAMKPNPDCELPCIDYRWLWRDQSRSRIAFLEFVRSEIWFGDVTIHVTSQFSSFLLLTVMSNGLVVVRHGSAEIVDDVIFVTEE
jgi:hypothetical protein